jgi:hypothetical protein
MGKKKVKGTRFPLNVSRYCLDSFISSSATLDLVR